MSPFTGRRRPDGSTELVSFERPHAFCDVPIRCGVCIPCRIHTTGHWSQRLAAELTCHDEAAFVTFTYADEHLPANGSLVKAHLRNYWKKLRHCAPPLRYYAVGEYGEKKHRPHYHAIVFGCSFRDDWVPARVSKRGHPQWTSESFAEHWTVGRGKNKKRLGDVYVGTVTSDSIGYVASYTTKKLWGALADEVYAGTGRIAPFAAMSRGRAGGIGAPFFKRHGLRMYAHDKVHLNGKWQRPAAYFDSKYTDTCPDEMAQLKDARRVAAEELSRTAPSREMVRELCYQRLARASRDYEE